MEAELKALEERVEQFVELSRQLRADNKTLRQQLAQSQNENKQLAEKVKAAKDRLETLLERLPEGG